MRTSIFTLVLLAAVILLMAGCKKEAPVEEAVAENEPAAAPAQDVKTTQESVTVETKPEAEAAAAPAESSGIAACDEYVKAFEKYMNCDAIPQVTKDATKQGLDSMKSTWSAMKDAPEDAKKATGDSCKMAMDGLMQGAKAMNCEM